MMPKTRRQSLRALAALLVGLFLAPAVGAAIIPDSQLQRALRKQQRLIAATPEDATLWNDLANLLMLGERAAEAEDAYKKSLEIDPELVTARYNLALLYQETHRAARSKRQLNRVLKHHPNHAWARYYLGVAHAEGGQRKAAIREFARAIRLEPDLTVPEVNPHVFDNPYLADAALRAYADTQGAELAPRLYENRERVVRSMVNPKALESAVMGTDRPARAGGARDSAGDGEEDPDDGR